MKRLFSKKSSGLALLLAGVMIMSCAAMPGCASFVKYEIPNYQGQLKDGQTKHDFNQELFYRNDQKIHDAADPFVLDNTSRDGYYYLYGTAGDLFCSRSKDLMNWEPVGNALDVQDYVNGAVSVERQVCWEDVWAPEVIYDPDDGRYYMFFSATPKHPDKSDAAGDFYGFCRELTMVAVSDRPDKGFKLVNFADPASCGEGNEHTFDKTSWPHYYADYMLFNPAEYMEFTLRSHKEAHDAVCQDPNCRVNAAGYYESRSFQDLAFRATSRGGYEAGIDPHPFVAADGTKYLYWVDCTKTDRISVVEMENWLKPKWETAKFLVCHNYYTVADYITKEMCGKSVELAGEDRNSINEGPFVIEHNGKVYLTFSIGAYSDNSYHVYQAVADSPDGDFRKLTKAEGGQLMTGDGVRMSGTGHHSLLQVGEQLVMIYHRHTDVVAAGGPRNPAVDEIKWITIKDKFGNDLDVMYSNGPTTTVQPKLEAYAEYKNIADEAVVSGHADAKYLNDGLLSTNKNIDMDFEQYVQETVIDKTTTFTFNFAEARTVRAIMVYNSKNEWDAFTSVARMELVCVENGKTVTRHIENVIFSDECFEADDLGNVYYIAPGAAAYAEFDELNVKSVKITIEVPNGQSVVGISEIRILGK